MMKFLSKVVLSLVPLLLWAKPPTEIPVEYVDQFTMNGAIPVVYNYWDNSYTPENPIFYSKETIDAYIEKAMKREPFWGYYGETDLYLYNALEKYPIKGKEVVIIGSVNPWYESIVLAFEGHPTTIDYNKIITDDSRLTLMTVEEFMKNPKKFDIVLSISSIEHDGLGRYGDPINPYGDLEFMKMAKEILLKKDGCMILAMPVGKDCLVWNGCRIYGSLRLPMLLEGWDLVGSFGFIIEDYQRQLGCWYHQPVFYLSPKN